MSNFHDFDPYDFLMNIGSQFQELGQQHNQLIANHGKLIKRIQALEQQLLEANVRLVFLETQLAQQEKKSKY